MQPSSKISKVSMPLRTSARRTPLIPVRRMAPDGTPGLRHRGRAEVAISEDRAQATLIAEALDQRAVNVVTDWIQVAIAPARPCRWELGATKQLECAVASPGHDQSPERSAPNKQR